MQTEITNALAEIAEELARQYLGELSQEEYADGNFQSLINAARLMEEVDVAVPWAVQEVLRLHIKHSGRLSSDAASFFPTSWTPRKRS
ncbi:hypothetical protein [Methylocystis parvus]|uniref:hypothetical protein n=1 Tax=Methylocystis parvus TaxID=134 RepID=UPI003C74A720